MSNTAYDLDAGKPAGAVDALDREIERFDVSLERLEKLLSPVLNSYGPSETGSDTPMAAPVSPLRGRAERLSDRLSRLDRIMNDIDL